jgi:NADH:ubiquinone oxidoreductase subunit F (NADH-binding)
MKLGSLCAHGGGIPAPIRSLLEHYPEQMRAGADEARRAPAEGVSS